MKRAHTLGLMAWGLLASAESRAADSIAPVATPTPVSAAAPACCSVPAPPASHGRQFQAEGVSAFATKLFDTSDFPARWYCGTWSSDVGWLHIVSDFGIFAAYFAIPCVLLFFMLRKRDLPFPKVIWLFAAFILACGLGHLIEAGIFWWPVYRFSGLIKGITASISWITVIVLIRLMPSALRLPSAAMLANKLIKSQARLDIALAGAKIGVWEIDLRANQVVADARTKEIFGLTENDTGTLFNQFSAVIHSQDREHILATLQNAVDQHDSFAIEFRVVLADGSSRYVQSQGKFVQENQAAESGSGGLLIGVCMDITEKHEKDAALLESEQNFRGTFENAAIGIAHVSVDGRWLKVNPALCNILGYTDAELVAMTAHELVHAEDRQLSLAKLKGAIDGQFDTYGIEKRLLRQDGSPVWVRVSVSIVRSVDGAPVHFVQVIEDIHRRKQTELELELYHQRVEKLSLVASKTQHSVVITDAGGKIEWCNEAFTRLTGYEVDEVLGRKPGEFLQGELTDPDSIDLIRRSLAERTSIAIELVNYHASGKPYWIELKIDPVLNEAGEVTNFIATQVDISERRKSEQHLRQAKLTAEQASKAKSEFLAAMSHELRTPLNGVIGMTELLSDSKLDSRQRRFVDACRKSGQHLLTLINDILDFSKIESGKMELDAHPFDLLQLINDSVESMSYRVDQKGLKMRCRLKHPVTMCLLGDSHRLRQVLTNLLGNAVKFTDEGMISIDIEPVIVTDQMADLRFRVKDTGIGIPEDRLQRLFQEFSQVDSSASRRFSGTGLGLSISKSIVQAMGGGIGVKSIEGLGSEFWFQVQLARTRFEQSLLPLAPHQLKGMRVLVVDNDSATLAFLSEIFPAWGMLVDTCESPAALPSLLENNQAAEPYDLLLVNAESEAGEVWMRQIIASDARMQNAQVFWLQSHEPLESDAARPSGDNDTLQKPLGPSMLLDALVERVCSGLTPQTILTGTGLLTSGATTDQTRMLRVLLAEDNATNQMFAYEIITRRGWQCEVANNGAEAVDALQRGEYDVVLMDCQMPVMDGLAATAAIRQFERSSARPAAVPIIALTANAIKGDRERCFAAGMDAYLSKPFSPASLLDLIQAVVADQAVIQPDPTQPANSEVAPDAANRPIDETRLLEDRCMGDLDFALSLLDSFAASSSQRLREITEHAQNGDSRAVSLSAHSLKGSAGIVLATRLSTLAEKIETAGKADDLVTIESWLGALADEVSACQQFIAACTDKIRLKTTVNQMPRSGGIRNET